MPIHIPHNFYGIITGLKQEEPNFYRSTPFWLNSAQSLQDLDDPLLFQSTYETLGIIHHQKLYLNPILFGGLMDLNNETIIQVHSRMHTTMLTTVFSLWFVKDNGCSLDSTIYVESATGLCRTVRGFSKYTSANFSADAVTYSEEDWIEADKYFRIFQAIESNSKTDESAYYQIGEGFRPDVLNYVDYNTINRIERAMIFLRMARTAPFLPAKISYYVLVLECLFSGGDSGEITYKVGHRIAGYINGDPEQKKKTFKAVVKFYNFRSRYLHGQNLDKNFNTLEKLIPVSSEIDELVRSIFRKIAVDHTPFLETDTTTFRAWLDDLLYQ